MKKIFLILFAFCSFLSFSQQINDYEFVMIPTKFKFQDSENQYHLSTLLKFRLEEYGFKAFYTSDQLNTNYGDRCRYLNVNVVEVNGFLNTKLYVVFNDCHGNEIFKSSMGMSKEKERKKGYTEALEIALKSVKALNYKFNGLHKKEVVNTEVTIQDANEKLDVVNENSLFAQPIVNGFQLVDTTPKVVLKIVKTSQSEFYIANSDTKNGVLFKKNNEWFFEYYANDKLISEKLIIKF